MGKGWLGGRARNWAVGSKAALNTHMHTQIDQKKKGIK